jgi:Putative addiction module component
MKLKKEMKQKVAEMPDNEKLVLLNYILELLDRPDPEVDKAWVKEVQRREKEMKTGKVKALTMDEVFGKYKK